MSSLSTSSLPRPLPDEAVGQPSVQLAIGQRVLVWCEKTKNRWKATILGRKEKNGIPGYYVHWERAAKNTLDWAPSDDITESE